MPATDPEDFDKAEFVPNILSGHGPKRAYQCADIYCKHPEMRLYGLLGDVRTPLGGDPEIEALEHRMGAARQLPSIYIPDAGFPFERIAEDDRRILLENHLARVAIMRAAMEAETARIKIETDPGWRTSYEAVAGIARRLRAKEWSLAISLDALPVKNPDSKHKSLVSVNFRYEHRSRTVLKHVSSICPRRVGRSAKLIMTVGLLLCVMFAVQTFAGILENAIFPYQPESASYENAPVFLFLNHSQIMADEDGYFQCWANGSVYLIAEIGGLNEAWGGDWAEFSIEEIGSDLPGERWYTTTTGLHSWAYQLPNELTLCNLTVPDWCRSRFTSLSVQPLYIAQGDVQPTRTTPVQACFNASGDIAVLIWSWGNFSDLALSLDDNTLIANDYVSPHEYWQGSILLTCGGKIIIQFFTRSCTVPLTLMVIRSPIMRNI